MKKEDVLNLMNTIPPDLVEEADVQAPAKRRLPKAVRTGLIAACLCLALVGTAFAVVEVFNANTRVDWEYSGISVDGYTVEYTINFYPVDAFSQEVADLAATYPGLKWYMTSNLVTFDSDKEPPVRHHKYFDTWDEMEDFIGLDLVSNPVLDRAEPAPTDIYTSPWEYDQGYQDPDKTHILIQPVRMDDGELRNIDATGHYLINGVSVRMTEMVYTERVEGELYYPGERGEVVGDGYHARYGFVYGADRESSAEGYTTPNGLTVTIITTTHPDGSVTYNAYFLIGGVAFNLIAYEDGEPSVVEPEQVREVFYAVLDGFELQTP